jgi:integrase
MATVFKKSIVRYLDASGKQVKKGTPGAKKVKEKSSKWYGRVPSQPRPVPLSADKKVAGILLHELIKKAENAKVGIGDPFEKHHRRPLAEHLADYRAVLKATGCGAKYIRDSVAAIERIIQECGFVFLTDISLSAVQEYLASLRSEQTPGTPLDPAKEWYTKGELAAAVGVRPHCLPGLVKRWDLTATGNGKARRYPRATALALRQWQARPIGLGTLNHYVAAAKGFTAWLVSDNRHGTDVLAKLSGFNAAADVRRGRRALTAEELQRVLQAARTSGQVFRGLAGQERHALYLTACTTGYRAGELAVLTPQAFSLASQPPLVLLGAEHTKNGKTAIQHIPDDVATVLRDHLAGKPAGVPVWPGGWSDNAADMLRIDLAAAGIPYAIEGPDGPLFADFHSLRHSYVALLDRCGATMKEAMRLARHSDPKLTMARYGKAQLHDLAGVAQRLTRLLLEDASTPMDASCPPVAYSVAVGCDSLPSVDQEPAGDADEGETKNPLFSKGLRAVAGG